MHFLANENIPTTSIRLLREKGLDVYAITECDSGISDIKVLEIAAREERVILTFDKDYGELIYKLKLPKPAGIILMRFEPNTPEEPGEVLLQLIAEKITFKGFFTVIKLDQIRQRNI